MQYILIEIEGVGLAYQEIAYGNVVRYTDQSGATIDYTTGGGVSRVIDANPTPPSWALADPVIPNNTVPSRIVTKLAYMDRFTDAELVNIYSAAKVSVAVEVWLAKFNVSSEIDLDDPRIYAGLHALEMAGLIGSGRAQEIVNE